MILVPLLWLMPLVPDNAATLLKVSVPVPTTVAPV